MTPLLRTIENPVGAYRTTFLKTGRETGGEFVLVRIDLEGHGRNFPHVHRTFEAVEGRLGVEAAGVRRVLSPGERVTVPRGVVHTFYGVGERAVFLAEVRPARRFEDTLRVLYGLGHDGLLRADGRPRSLLHLALLVQLSESQLPGVPPLVGRAGIGALTLVARLTGAHRPWRKYLREV